jgi:hypothetical protein
MLFLILAAHCMMEPARGWLFPSRLPVTALPWMYILGSIASLLAVGAAGRLAARIGHSILMVLLLASAGIACAFWVRESQSSPPRQPPPSIRADASPGAASRTGGQRSAIQNEP